jgi:protein-disulfide isomerase
MTNKNSLVLLLLGAVIMVAAVFGALHFAGGLSGSNDDAPDVAMSKGDVEKIVKNYLLENPQIIFEAIDRLKSREGEERLTSLRDNAKKHAAQLFGEPEPIVAGNPKGDVTVVEFFDYHCPYCKKVKQTMVDLLKQDGGVRLVLKEYPILSKESEFAARAAVASLEQGKYWDFHLGMMGADDLSEESVFAIAKQAGLDIAKLRTDMRAAKVEARLVETQKLGQTIGVDATPTFFIGDQPYTGAMTLKEMKEAITAVRKARPS